MTWTRYSCVLLLGSFFLPGQESFQARDGTLQNGTTQQAQDVRERIRVRSDLVVLSVTVRDGKGNLVAGLRPQDFHVFDDAIEQKIIVFAAEGLPLSLVILVDNDMKWKEGTEMTKSLGAIAGGMSVADEAMVCRYDMLFYPGDKFTSVSGNLMDALKATQSAASPSPQYIPQPLNTDPVSTSRLFSQGAGRVSDSGFTLVRFHCCIVFLLVRGLSVVVHSVGIVFQADCGCGWECETSFVLHLVQQRSAVQAATNTCCQG